MTTERKTPLPFSESDLGRTLYDIRSTGERWKGLTDDELVGMVGHSQGTAKTIPEWILSGARAEFQRRQNDVSRALAELQRQHIDATSEATAVQRRMLRTIEEFNEQAGQQTIEMLTLNRSTLKMTRRIEFLTWVIAFLATAQLAAMIYQIFWHAGA